MTCDTVVIQLFPEGEEIDRERIVNQDLAREECFCSICQCLVWKPRACSTCHQIFCEKCIQTWLDNPTSQNKCPFRCQPFKDDPCSLEIQSALSRLNIRCRNASFGCSEIVPYDQLEQHENIQCQYPTKRCSKCEQWVLVSKFDEHQQSKDLCHPCPIKCTICRNYFESALMQEHFHQCCNKKLTESMTRVFRNPYNQTRNGNQIAQTDVAQLAYQYMLTLPALFQQQKEMSRLPTSLKGVDAVQRAREQNHAYLYHMFVMLKFVLLNWTKIPFFILMFTFDGFLAIGIAGLGLYVLFCQQVCRNIYSGFPVLIIITCLSTYSFQFICQLFSDQTIILFFELAKFFLICATHRVSLEIFEFSPLFNRPKLCILLYCLALLVIKISLLFIRLFYSVIPTPIAAVLFISVNSYLALNIYCLPPGVTAPVPVN